MASADTSKRRQQNSRSRRKLTAIVLGAAIGLPMLTGKAIAVEPSGPSNQLSRQSEARQTRSSESVILGSRTFLIPFAVDEKPGQQVDVHLFVARPSESASDDTGNPGNPTDPEQWQWIESKLAKQGTSQQFEFTAASDGEYWFTTQVTQHDAGKPVALVSELPPQQKIYVDTTQPSIDMTAESDGDGRIHVAANIHDASPVGQMLLRYITDEMSQWVTVDSASLRDRESIAFDVPGQWSQISVELVVKDSAGNQGSSSQLVRRPRIAEAIGPRYADAGLSQTHSHRLPFFPRRGGGVTTNSPAYGQPTGSATNGYRSVPGYVAPQVPSYNVPNDPVIRLDRNQSNNTLRRAVGPQQQSDAPTSPGDRVSQLRPLPGAGSPELSRPTLRNRLTPARPAAQRTEPNAAENGFAVILNSTSNDPLDLDAAGSGNRNTPAADSDANSRPSQLVPETIPTPRPKIGPQARRQQQRARSVEEALKPLGSASSVPESLPSEASSAAGAGSGSRVESARPSLAPSAPRLRSSSEVLSRVPVRFSDNKRFSLDYVLEAVGSRGVEAVDLYGSVDEGQTWKLWGRDPDRQSPFDIETREEGTFSYRIVVVGSNGLASARPLAGDLPDIVVVVDTTEPEVRLSGASYGQGDQIGSLVIQYECRDRNLKERPITLSFSESLDGPWTTIAGGLLNTGQYAWPADPSLPRAFYLRIDAVDKSGNRGTYILDRPIDAQGLAPRARIRGFQSLSGS